MNAAMPLPFSGSIQLGFYSKITFFNGDPPALMFDEASFGHVLHTRMPFAIAQDVIERFVGGLVFRVEIHDMLKVDVRLLLKPVFQAPLSQFPLFGDGERSDFRPGFVVLNDGSTFDHKFDVGPVHPDPATVNSVDQYDVGVSFMLLDGTTDFATGLKSDDIR
jgi:hypothetical protein